MKLSVTRYKEMNSGGLHGFVDLLVEDIGLVIHGCAYREGQKGMWVAVPSRKYEDGGEVKYIGHVGFPERSDYNDFQDSAKSAIEEYLSGKGHMMADDMPF